MIFKSLPSIENAVLSVSPSPLTNSYVWVSDESASVVDNVATTDPEVMFSLNVEAERAIFVGSFKSYKFTEKFLLIETPELSVDCILSS